MSPLAIGQEDRRMSKRRWLPLLLVMLVGCNEANPASRPSDTPSPLPASDFEQAGAGSVRGRVVWQGEVPQVPPFEVRAILPANDPGKSRSRFDHPNAPRIDPVSHGVEGAIVFLKG